MPIKKKKRVVKNPRIPRTHNGGTMTSAAFFGMLRNMFRQKSMHVWKPISQVKNEAKVLYKGTNKRQRVAFKCGQCGNEVASSKCAVHHKVPCGSLTSFADISSFCQRLFCEKDGLILLCDKCHTEIHKK